MEGYLIITAIAQFGLWVLSERYTDQKFRILLDRIQKLEEGRCERQGSWPNGTLVIATVKPIDPPLVGEN